MGQSSSSHHKDRQRHDIEFEQPSPYASAVVRKTPNLGGTSNGGMRRERSIRHDASGVGGFQSNHHYNSSSTTSSSQKSTEMRYIPKIPKSGKGLIMPRGGAPLHGGGGGGAPADHYTSPDSWGFHINITPTQDVYAANVAGSALENKGLDPKRRQNQVFQNLQSSNTTNMGWTSVPI